MQVYLGIDLGGTNLRVGVRAVGDERLLALESVPARGEWSAADLLDRIEALVREAARGAAWQVVGVGGGLTGDIDFRTGTCYSMKRFPGLEEAPLAALLEARFRAPARILNDGLTAALAELRAGAGRDGADWVMVTLGTGIGGAVVMDGRVMTGRAGRIGKAGHQILDLQGPVHCHCGLSGCWQSLAGKEGITARARAAAAPGSALAALVDGGDFDLWRLAELADRGDPDAVTVIDDTGRFVGIGLANLIKILAPERVLIGGGIAERNARLLAAVQRTVREYAVKPYQDVPVVPAALGKDAGVVGATYLAEGVLSG